MGNKKFINVSDVAEYLDVSIPMAYKIIRHLNEELSEQGYITIAGKVSRAYFEQKVYAKTSA